MKRLVVLCAAALAAGSFAAGPGPVAPGGALTRQLDNREAFTRPAPGLSPKELRDFNFGNRLFNTNWAVAPASVDAFDGLGPVFNRVSCSGCHLRDGRGRPPVDGEDEMLSMLVRLSVPGVAADGGPVPHPAYGDQLNDRAIPGVRAEGRARIEWRELPGSYPDGTAYSLRAPTLAIDGAAFGELADDVLFSARVAPAMPGLGLLGAVPESAIVALEDPDDRNGDGISGRANRVWDPVTQREALGRFGWKANQATLLAQTAGAANGDMGLTTRVHPDENCIDGQSECGLAKRGGDGVDLRDAHLDKLVFYLETLAVPARRVVDADAEARGERLFSRLGCGGCHRPVLETAADAMPALLAGQTFAPYTDLLLHDMGPGLADGRPDFRADGREWRTPPLWGLGLVPTTNGHSFYLHDGRARSLEEAVLWHGGEAERARQGFENLSSEDREAVLAFLRSV